MRYAGTLVIKNMYEIQVEADSDDEAEEMIYNLYNDMTDKDLQNYFYDSDTHVEDIEVIEYVFNR